MSMKVNIFNYYVAVYIQVVIVFDLHVSSDNLSCSVKNFMYMWATLRKQPIFGDTTMIVFSPILIMSEEQTLAEIPYLLHETTHIWVVILIG